ncbi:hypothetical protein ACOWLO_05795 [Helicobacter pylori]
MEKNDRYEIVTNVIESLENGGSFNQRDREKFMQVARTLGIEDSVIVGIEDSVIVGIEDSVIEEMIDIYQTLSLIYRHEDLINASDLPREQKKVVCAELQKSINENLKALENIKNNI